MFGIGFPELVIILIVALLVFGPSKLPELARSLGKAMHELKRMTDDVKATIEEEIVDIEPPLEKQREGETDKEPLTTGAKTPEAAEATQEPENKGDSEHPKSQEGMTRV